IPFEDSNYLELIAFGGAEPRRVLPRHVRARELSASSHTAMERHWLPWATAPEGLIDFAVRPTSVDDAIREAASRGLKLEGPIAGGRMRPDGQQVSWQMAIADTPDLPFLCADLTARSLRVPDGDARQHSNATVGIKDLTIAVNDLTSSIGRYGALL